MMRFYFTPGACSIGIHILLEELDLVFEAYLLNLMNGDQHKPEFLAINPKGTIPTLVCDNGTSYSEYQAIAYWLARKYPKAHLLPDDMDLATKAMEIMDYVVGTIHGQGFLRIFVPEKFNTAAEAFPAIKQEGEVIVNKAFAILNAQIADSGYCLGDFSIADAALFYVEFWALRSGIQLPANCLQHYRLMLSRPAVKRVLLEEGYRLE